ncbi:MAG: Sec-independent protein translocase protein TatB [Syntrophorhabdaceae bacterium]
MFGIGLPELILILIVALLVVGPKKLPELARSVGKAIHDVRKMGEDVKESLVEDLKNEPETMPEEGRKENTSTKEAGDSKSPGSSGEVKPDPYNNVKG